nr:hypothetical protein [uncultured Treponema sp.]
MIKEASIIFFKNTFSGKKNRVLSILSICSLVASIACLLFLAKPISQKIFETILIYRPNLKPEKIEFLKSTLSFNGLLFFIFAVSFQLFRLLKFKGASEETPNLNFFAFRKESFKAFNSKRLMLLLAIFAVISFTRLFWASQKKSIHIDEMYGISIITQNEYGLWSGKPFENNRTFTGKEIKEKIFFDNPSIKDTFRDLAHLFVFNRVKEYNNLHLYISRLFFTGFKSDDINETTNRAALMNLFFFAFSFYFFCLTVRMLTPSKTALYLLPILAFLNPVSIGLSVFFRSYALQETMLILFTYVFIFYLKNIEKSESLYTKSVFFKTAIVAFLLFSTDYFSVFYLMLCGLILIASAIIKKKYYLIFFLICSVLLGLIFAKCFYLNYGIGYFSGRGSEAMDVFQGGILENLRTTFSAVVSLISGNFVSIFILIAGIAVQITNTRLNRNPNAAIKIIVFAVAFVWITVVIFLAPYKTLRYVGAVFPLLVLVLSIDVPENKKYINGGIQAAFFLVSITCILNVLPFESNFSKIEHLNDCDEAVLKGQFLYDKTIPVVISQKTSYPWLLPYLDDNQCYIFADSIETLDKSLIMNDYFWYILYDNSNFTFTEKLLPNKINVR